MFESLLDLLRQPWPWYVSGPLIGLTVPLLLLLGNRSFGISSNLSHLCAIALPQGARPKFLKYDWRPERWNLVFMLGLLLSGLLGALVLTSPQPTQLSAPAVASLHRLGVEVGPGMVPAFMGTLDGLLRPKTLALLALSGVLVGFGTRYGGGCTSGHAITGLSTLQWPSLVATVSFFAGGILSANVLLPLFLN